MDGQTSTTTRTCKACGITKAISAFPTEGIYRRHCCDLCERARKRAQRSQARLQQKHRSMADKTCSFCNQTAHQIGGSGWIFETRSRMARICNGCIDVLASKAPTMESA